VVSDGPTRVVVAGVREEAGDGAGEGISLLSRRASLIAHCLKTTKPRSKLLLLDAKDAFSKRGLFLEGWEALYKDIVEWVPAAKDGKVVRIDAKTLTVETELGTIHKAGVLNVIPQQSAGRIAIDSGLADASGWVPIVPR